jgi:hypothetical protein
VLKVLCFITQASDVDWAKPEVLPKLQSAFEFATELLRLTPTATSPDPAAETERLLSTLLPRVRHLPPGDVLVVPAGWCDRPDAALPTLVLLVLRRCAPKTDADVFSASVAAERRDDDASTDELDRKDEEEDAGDAYDVAVCNTGDGLDQVCDSPEIESRAFLTSNMEPRTLFESWWTSKTEPEKLFSSTPLQFTTVSPVHVLVCFH